METTLNGIMLSELGEPQIHASPEWLLEHTCNLFTDAILLIKLIN